MDRLVVQRLIQPTFLTHRGTAGDDMAEQRKIALFAEVHKVVRYLHDEGKCPTAERVTPSRSWIKVKNSRYSQLEGREE